MSASLWQNTKTNIHKDKEKKEWNQFDSRWYSTFIGFYFLLHFSFTLSPSLSLSLFSLREFVYLQRALCCKSQWKENKCEYNVDLSHTHTLSVHVKCRIAVKIFLEFDLFAKEIQYLDLKQNVTLTTFESFVSYAKINAIITNNTNRNAFSISFILAPTRSRFSIVVDSVAFLFFFSIWMICQLCMFDIHFSTESRSRNPQNIYIVKLFMHKFFFFCFVETENENHLRDKYVYKINVKSLFLSITRNSMLCSSGPSIYCIGIVCRVHTHTQIKITISRFHSVCVQNLLLLHYRFFFFFVSHFFTIIKAQSYIFRLFVVFFVLFA